MLIKLYETPDIKIELREKIINDNFHEYTIRITGKNIKEEKIKYYNKGEAIENYYKIIGEIDNK